jgi:hypothetical protein
LTTGIVVALLGAAANPAGAAGTAVGVVTGTVLVSPGLTTTPTDTTFTFDPTITGVFVGADATEGGSTTVNTTTEPVGAASYEGPVTTGLVSGGALQETCAQGTGILAGPILFTGSTTATVGTQTLTHTVDGDIGAGIFVRVGPVVEAVFTTNVTILVKLTDELLLLLGDVLFKSTTHSTITGVVEVLLGFVPASGDCVTTPVIDATLAGKFGAGAV